MIVLVWALSSCWLVVDAETVEVKIQAYKPPSQQQLLDAYFGGDGDANGNRTKKSIENAHDRFYKSLEDVSRGFLNLTESERTNETDRTGDHFYDSVDNYARTAFFKNYLTLPVEPTTYRYPTAVWSSHTYEKLKNNRKNGAKSALKGVQAYTAQASVRRGGNSSSSSEKSQRRYRGKTKWKDVQIRERADSLNGDDERTDFVDKFLQESLTNYLTSSNLKAAVGNVSVKTFSELLKNVTGQKTKRPQSPYDENKELRMKFREEVILKKGNSSNGSSTNGQSNETKTQGNFLEKQLQKRLEKVQNTFNEKNKEKILANMWKYATLNRTIEHAEEIRGNKTLESETATTLSGMPLEKLFLTQPPTKNPKKSDTTAKHMRGTVKYNRSRHTSTEKNRYDGVIDEEGDRRNLLKLTAEESSYYRQGRFPSLTFIGQPEKPAVIPGTPYVDYPMHSFPPTTKFKCPKFKSGKPKMMADRETRCQVFYVCTGDGPTTAMLCPNGTMFNENFLVCDWWYNVHC